MDCPECDRLTAEYERRKRHYFDAVELLFATGWQVTDGAHGALKNSVEEARAQWEISRFRLNTHKSDHERTSR
jgi:hypothetical protein